MYNRHEIIKATLPGDQIIRRKRKKPLQIKLYRALEYLGIFSEKRKKNHITSKEK